MIDRIRVVLRNYPPVHVTSSLSSVYLKIVVHAIHVPLTVSTVRANSISIYVHLLLVLTNVFRSTCPLSI